MKYPENSGHFSSVSIVQPSVLNFVKRFYTSVSVTVPGERLMFPYIVIRRLTPKFAGLQLKTPLLKSGQ